MSVTVVNATGVQPVYGTEINAATLSGGPYDNVSVYVSGGASPSGGPTPLLQFRLYATVGSLTSLVAQTSYASSDGSPVLLQWLNPQKQLSAIVNAGGTVFRVVVFAVNQGGTPLPAPNTINVTVAGVNASDVAADTNTAATVSVGAAFTQIATANGYIPFADIGAALASLPACNFEILANCSPGSLEAQVASGAVAPGSSGNVSVLRQVQLPVATQYRLLAQRADGVATPVNVTASLSTYVSESGGGGGAVVLNGEVTGPAGSNVVTGPFSQASLKWAVAVAAASLGTNLANATFALQFDAAHTALLLDPVAGDSFLDVGGVTRASVSLAHGVIVAGGGGTDYTASIGPLTGFETSDAALWLLPNGIARSASNFTIFNSSSSLFIGPRLTGGTISFVDGGGGTFFFKMSASVQETKTPIQYDIVAAPVAVASSVNVYCDTADSMLKAIGANGDITIIGVS